MSMVEWLQTLEDNGRLVRVVPTLSLGDDPPRTLLVSPEVAQTIYGPWPHEAAESRGSILRADLEYFAAGAMLNVCNRPFKAQSAQMGLLAPVADGVWDLRSQDRPGIRVLGMFAEADCFLGLIAASRSVASDFLPWGPLGSKDSPEWKAATSATRKTMQSLSPIYPPVTGDDVRDYLTFNTRLV